MQRCHNKIKLDLQTYAKPLILLSKKQRRRYSDVID